MSTPASSTTTTSTTVDTSKFSLQFRTRPEFNDIVDKMNGSPYLVNMVNSFPGQVVLGQAGGGTYYSQALQQITVDADWVADTTDASFRGQFVTVLSHEFGHAVQPNGYTPVDNDQSIQANLNNSLQGEGVAVLAEYRTARDLGVPMWSDGNGQLKITLDKLAAQYKDNLDDPAFIKKATQLGADLYSNMRPSTNPTLTYTGYYLSQICNIPPGLRGRVDFTTVDLNKTKPNEVGLSIKNASQDTYKLISQPNSITSLVTEMKNKLSNEAQKQTQNITGNEREHRHRLWQYHHNPFLQHGHHGHHRSGGTFHGFPKFFQMLFEGHDAAFSARQPETPRSDILDNRQSDAPENRQPDAPENRQPDDSPSPG